MSQDTYVIMMAEMQRAAALRQARRGYPAPVRPRRRRRRRDVT